MDTSVMEVPVERIRQFLQSSSQSDIIARKFFLVISLFVLIVASLLVLDRFQAYVLDSVRAYVAGEGFWSKGQKDAVYHLVRYAGSADENDYRKFLAGMAINQGDRQARLALQAGEADIAAARKGFLGGQNHPDDVDHLISFFLHFSEVGDMKQAIVIWTEADGKIDQLMGLGEQLHQILQVTPRDAGRIEVLLGDIDHVHDEVDALERRFSATLGHAARKMETLTERLLLIAALLLLMTGISLSWQVVHGLRRAQQALEASESRFRHVVESNIIGIMFWHMDGTIFDANDAFLDIVGYSRTDLEQGRVNWHGLTPEEGRGEDEAALQELYERGSCTPYEKQYLHRDGHRLTAYLSAALFTDSKDAGVCFVLDISERKRAEQAQKLAATVFNAAREGIVVTDSSAVIKAVNPAFTMVTGYTPEEVIGKNPHVLSSGHHDAAFYETMWKRLRSHGNWKGEVWNRRKDGEIYQEWLSISVIRDEAGKVSEYVGVFSDITEQRKMEEQVRQSQKMEAIGTLVGGIAHDFNNTLAAMQGNLYLAQRYNGDNVPVTTKLDVIQELLSHSAEMVTQLLTFARKGMVQMAELSLSDLFMKLECLIGSIIPENIEFDMQLCERRLFVRGDATQLQQVMLNLLNNARDAIDGCELPQIHCRLDYWQADRSFMQAHPQLETNELGHITVTDNGCGIAEQQLAHIFEPFYTTKEVGKGTGLGMAMVYGSMQTHHGVIEVESSVGQGTTVHLYLPLIQVVEPVRRTNMPLPDSVPGSQQSATILLVDDNEHIRNFCSEVLLQLGFEVLLADDGEDALACFQHHQADVDLVISDMVMPRMGGFQTVEKMRLQRPDLPVIFMTGYDPEQVVIPDELAGNSAMVSKPFDMDTFARVVDAMLAARAESSGQ
ncbi:PAS domain S-box protein [Mariprofundus erugo]|uniref:histidine kinase n=1 Tax=Mariprofundus erugo TaxID=2528639 RepID=A0A5R9GSR8_9PROT|nr:PAS domain S-box protein [Mariprofundus erugo]TLS69226.1 PAS domain S-box protein [Mariprofundus erugo]